MLSLHRLDLSLFAPLSFYPGLRKISELFVFLAKKYGYDYNNTNRLDLVDILK